MKNLGQLMKQAQQMQQKMAEMQAELEAVEMTGIAGGGMVQLTLNGKGDMKKLKLDKSVVDPADTEVLEDLIVAAFNDARAKVNAHAEAEMQKLTGGLALPGGMKLPIRARSAAIPSATQARSALSRISPISGPWNAPAPSAAGIMCWGARCRR